MSSALIVGNWKMNGLIADLAEAQALADALAAQPASARVGLCVPATLVMKAAETLAGSAVAVGAQDAHAEPGGAYTGDISAEMLADAGARLLIVGHSERRAAHCESDAVVRAKAKAGVRAGLEPIVCVGETLEQRKAGQALAVVTGQVAGSVDESLAGVAFAVAYEPVWAIGTGLTPTLAEIEEVHGAIRRALAEKLGAAGERAPILYGGSVKPANAADILAVGDVGGALVGGASLKAADFLQIVRAAEG
jgi:triosephosphate isomerase